MKRARGLEYEVAGDGEAVIFIHDAIVADAFAPIMTEPALGGYRLIRYRRRGYGGSDAPTSPPSIEEHARDAQALLAHLGVTRAHVVGHSGGGPIAFQLTIDAPDMVRSLILLEPVLQTAAMAPRSTSSSRRWSRCTVPATAARRYTCGCGQRAARTGGQRSRSCCLAPATKRTMMRVARSSMTSRRCADGTSTPLVPHRSNSPCSSSSARRTQSGSSPCWPCFGRRPRTPSSPSSPMPTTTCR